MQQLTFHSAFAHGALVMAGLIITLGPQNIMAIRHGVARVYALRLAALFIAADALLILLGVTLAKTGFAFSGDKLPALLTFVAVAYLSWIGLNSLSSAFSRDSGKDISMASSAESVSKVLMAGAAVTFLNPGVYLDTLGLIGVLAVKHQPQHWALALGAISTSVVWFLAIVLCGRLCSPLFRSARAWKVLELVAGAVMLVVAWQIYNLG